MINTEILSTTYSDWPTIRWLFDQARHLQGKEGYKVWSEVDEETLRKDIQKSRQYKVVNGRDTICVFSIQWTDPLIWRERDQHDALYLHRIVTHPHFRGQRLFETVLSWALSLAKSRGSNFIRLDTWADNRKIIDYYRSFGFTFIENYTTSDDPRLPVQNRNLGLALLELPIVHT